MRSRTTLNTHDTPNVNTSSLSSLNTNNYTTGSILHGGSGSSSAPSLNSTSTTSITTNGTTPSVPYCYRSSGTSAISTSATSDNNILPIYEESNHKDASIHTVSPMYNGRLRTFFHNGIDYLFFSLFLPIIHRIPYLQSYSISIMNYEYRNQRIRKRYLSLCLISIILLFVCFYLMLFSPSNTYITDSSIYQQYLVQSLYTTESCTALGYSQAQFTKSLPVVSTTEAAPKTLSDALSLALQQSGSSSSSSPSSITQRIPERTKHIVLTESNIGFAPITENWLRQWKNILYPSNDPNTDNIQLFIVGLDTTEYFRIRTTINQLTTKEMKPFISTWIDPDTSFASNAQGFFSSGYLAIVFHKWKLLSEALSSLQRNSKKETIFSSSSSSISSTTSSVDGILLMDVDSLPFRNPLKYIETLPYCDAYFATETAPDKLFTSSDIWYPEPNPSKPWYTTDRIKSLFFSTDNHNDENSMDDSNQYANVKLTSVNYINTGFMYLRTTVGARKFVDTVVKKLSTIDASKKNSLFDSDQAVANHVLEIFRRSAIKNNEPIVTVPDIFRQPGRPSCARYGNFTFYLFNPYFFQNGKHAWENGGLIRSIYETPFMRHYNYLGFSPESKVAAMKTDGIWLLSKEEEDKLSCQMVQQVQ